MKVLVDSISSVESVSCICTQCGDRITVACGDVEYIKYCPSCGYEVITVLLDN